MAANTVSGLSARRPVLVVAGARPNFMKVVLILHELDRRGLPRLFVHTGQHYDVKMSEQLLTDLRGPMPDVLLEVGSATHAVQTARIMERFEPVLMRHQSSWVVVVGDVNSTLACALVTAKVRHDIDCRIAHVESGLRSHDWSMPEEVNRVLTDRLSDLLLTPVEEAAAELAREGLSAIRTAFAVVVYWASQRYSVARLFGRFIVITPVALLVAGMLGSYLDSPWPWALLSKRGVMTPGELHLIYADYFSNGARLPIWQIFDTNSPDGSGLGVAEIIQSSVFGGTIGNGEGANAGMLATAYARYGCLGVAVHSATVVLILMFLDKYRACGRSAWIPYAAIPAIFMLTNADLIGAILYRGLGFAVALTIAGSSAPGSRLPGKLGTRRLLDSPVVQGTRVSGLGCRG